MAHTIRRALVTCTGVVTLAVAGCADPTGQQPGAAETAAQAEGSSAGDGQSVSTAMTAGSSGGAPTPMPVSTTIVLSTDTGDEFQPTTAVPTQVSAESAWDQFQTESAGTAIPSNISAELGYLSLPLSTAGPESTRPYTMKDELVWGFSFDSPCVSTLPAATAQPSQCKRWVFLSPSDGSFVYSTYQHLNG